MAESRPVEPVVAGSSPVALVIGSVVPGSTSGLQSRWLLTCGVRFLPALFERLADPGRFFC